MDYFFLFLGWALYFFLHSFLAAKKVKEKAGIPSRAYRIIYIVISSVGLLFMLYLNGAVSGELLLEKTALTEYASLILAGSGVIVINAAFRVISFSEFVGLSEHHEELQIKGIYRYVRHPIYSGTILITIGFFFFDPRPSTAISVLCTWIYLVIGIYLEERKLIEMFGNRYREYRRDVAAVIPYVL